MTESGEPPVYVQELEPVADSLGLSALVAALPLVIVLVLLGGVRVKAHLAGLTGLLAAVLVAWLAYGMPLGQTVSSAAQGAAFGLFPILWIVVNALWVYRMTVRTRHFDILRRSFGRLSDDPRIQALVVAFCFGALLEALAGFGAPVAICSVMLVALGFDPVRAAVVALVANTAPVAFGAMGTPVVTLAQVTGLPFSWPIVSTGGTLVLLAGVCTAVVLKVHARVAVKEWAATVHELRFAILTVTSVLGLAYVMNLSGQAATIGHFVAAAGAGLAFLSPVLGWFGVAVSGSDTSANALFGALQVTAARESGLSPELLAAANSSGGVLGKMISPQNLTIACAAVGLAGREGDLLRKVVPWSAGLLLVMCLIVVGQSSPVLGWMLP
ncbi:hypothetical protein SALBM311S_04663 [Streptomyces alboniger]